MERPILNPSVFDDPDRQPLEPMPREPWHAGRLLWQFARAVGGVAKASWHLLWTPIVPRRLPRPDEKRSVLVRVVAPVVFRLMALATLLLGTVVLQAYLLSHPPVPSLAGPPVTGGVHVERVTLTASDGVPIEAYLAPAVNETNVLKHGELAVRAKWPAVVLVADQRGDGHDLDKLIRTLHESGYVSILVRLRGTGDDDLPQTLGLQERRDVAAAVSHLRALNYVDQNRVSVLGTGTGATAAMLARRDDRTIAAAIVYDPVVSFDDVLASSTHPRAAWMRPAVRWTYEVSNQVDVDELDRDALIRNLHGQVLLLSGHPSRPPQRQMIAAYLQAGSIERAQMSVAR
jgi:hypothetical protein